MQRDVRVDQGSCWEDNPESMSEWGEWYAGNSRLNYLAFLSKYSLQSSLHEQHKHLDQQQQCPMYTQFQALLQLKHLQSHTVYTVKSTVGIVQNLERDTINHNQTGPVRMWVGYYQHIGDNAMLLCLNHISMAV